MTINRLGLAISMLCTLALFSDGLGYDIYAHGVVFYFHEYILNHTDLLFNSIVMPRYLLLSYISEITRIIGIPLGIITCCLIILPTYNVGKVVSQNGSKVLSLSDAGILFSLLSLSFFYSGLSLVLLWMIALLVTKKPFFLIGAFFHPVGLILATMLIFAKKLYIIKYLWLNLIFFSMLYISTKIGYFTSSKYYDIRYNINLDSDNLRIIFNTVLLSKLNEIIILVIILLISILAKSKLRKLFLQFQGFSINRFTLIMFFSFIIISINLYFAVNKRHTLIIDIISFNISEPVYATWFDWGERDLLNESPISLYNKRYDDRRYMQ